MRKPFAEAVIRHLDPARSVFLTGDLGFMALEEVRAALGERFINAGVAEQNMISAAAGLARTGLEVWAYSIAPFLYARPFEQIRNDVCLHRLPVYLAGNGGGYGYGVMGPSHHALEDYGVLLTLQGMRAFLPVFNSDLDPLIPLIQTLKAPTYLRLGREEPGAGQIAPAYAAWRRLTRGEGPLVAVAGALAGGIALAVQDLEDAVRPEVWAVAELPVAASPPPADFLARVDRAPALWAVEEHVAQGGFGGMLTLWLLERGYRPNAFRHWCARGYPGGRYGSQEYHRAESGIAAQQLRQAALEGSMSWGSVLAV